MNKKDSRILHYAEDGVYSHLLCDFLSTIGLGIVQALEMFSNKINQSNRTTKLREQIQLLKKLKYTAELNTT
jgi:hypothetical protein